MYSRNYAPQPRKPHVVPIRPWRKVGTDLFCCDGKDYLVIVDHMARYPELLQLKATSRSTAVTALKSVCARFDVPDVVMSDNGLQCRAKEFANVAKNCEFAI